MFCKFCGAQLDDNAAFCSKCGANLSAPAEQPTAPVEQPAEVAATPEGNGTPAPTKKAISEKTHKTVDKCFLAGTIVGAVGAGGFLLIVLLGLILYGRVYLFDGYTFTKALSIISIIFMLTGLCSVIAKMILSLRFKIGTFPKKVFKRILLIALAVFCLGFSIWGFVDCAANAEDSGYSSSSSVSRNRLRTAYNTVVAQYGTSLCLSIASDGSYISVDTNPLNIDDYYSATYTNILKAMNNALGLPAYVYQSMITTTALMGRQTATANGITVSWTYHPNRGLEAMYILAK